MKRSMIAVLTLVMEMSTLTFAQGRGNHGKPAATGLEGAEQVANPNGVSKGIDTAETEQAQQKTKKSSKSHPCSQLGGRVAPRCSPSVETAPSNFSRR